MPLDKYFSGSGEKVMRNMVGEYGAKKGKQVFYATANKRKTMKDALAERVYRGKFKKAK